VTVIVFDLNGTLTDPGAIGAPWGARDLGTAVLAAAVQSAMVDTILGQSRPFREHIEAALRDVVSERGLRRDGGHLRERARLGSGRRRARRDADRIREPR
jgi:phosphoserine phosphatase